MEFNGRVPVTEISEVHESYHLRDVRTPILKVPLSDGRVLEASSERVSQHAGTSRILALDGVGKILAVEDEK